MAPNGESTAEVKLEEGVDTKASVDSRGGSTMIGKTTSSRASVVVQNSVTEQVHSDLEKKKDILRKEEKKGHLESRTVSDAVTGGGKASNPDAVDQLGLDILNGFRRKVFGLLVLQAAVIWGLAALIARIPFIVDRNIFGEGKENKELYIDCGIAGGIFLLAVVALGVVSYFRYHWPWSLIALSIFTVIISTFLGVVCGPNIYLGMGLALGGMALVAIPSCIRFKDRMIEVFPVAMFVSAIVLAVGIIGWLTLAPEIHGKWVIPGLLLNSVGMVWLGYEMDWICSRLNPDEYLLPICLVWSEILTTVLLAILMVMGGDSCEAGGCGGGVFYGGLYCHCDCWLYSDGDSSRKQYYRNLDQFQAPEGPAGGSAAPAPAQQAMPPANAPGVAV